MSEQNKLNLVSEIPFDEILIKEYLADNPDFFSRNPELLLGMRVPHAERGAVSLVERKQEMLRQRVQQLEEEITVLMTTAMRNEEIFHFNTRLSMDMLACDTMADLRELVAKRLKGQFGFSHVRLIGMHDIDSELAAIWSKRLHSGHYFGRLTSVESNRLFGGNVGSVALSRLSDKCGQVMFAVASPNATHFHPEMDHLLLDQVIQTFNYLIPKY